MNEITQELIDEMYPEYRACYLAGLEKAIKILHQNNIYYDDSITLIQNEIDRIKNTM